MNAHKESKAISLMHLDKTLHLEIEKIIGKETPKICYQCNMCSGGCPVAEYMEYPPHMIMQMSRLGMAEQLLSSQAIWVCTLCLKCKERCPQHTSAVDAIWALRQLAIQRGYTLPLGYEAMAKQVGETGNIYEIIDLTFEDREELELPDISHPNHEEYQKMLKRTGLFEILKTAKALLKKKETQLETNEENKTDV